MFPKVIEAAYNFAEESSLISLFKYVALASLLSDLLQPDLQPAIFSLGVKRDALEQSPVWTLHFTSLQPIT